MLPYIILEVLWIKITNFNLKNMIFPYFLLLEILSLCARGKFFVSHWNDLEFDTKAYVTILESLVNLNPQSWL